MKKPLYNRRKFVQSSAFGLFSLSAIRTVCAKNVHSAIAETPPEEEKLFYRYPALPDTLVAEVVGAAHARFDRVKELVRKRSELANATWDWGFGDIESAIGAAAHMGRSDIARFLLDHGARPDHFTFAMLGEVDALKAMIEAQPGLQRTPGPHGISLLQHAKIRIIRDNVKEEERKKVAQTIAYLESLGDADNRATSLVVSKEEQKIYLGEYRFGKGEDEIFEVKINSRGLLSIARKETFGRVMNKVDKHIFSPGGAPSVKISFKIEASKAISLTIHEPEPLVLAHRVQ